MDFGELPASGLHDHAFGASHAHPGELLRGLFPARRARAGIGIGARRIDADAPVFLIAEIGNNHNGDAALARRLIDEAAAAGADCAKFQLRDLEALYGARRQGSNDLGAEYTLDLLERFQLGDEALRACLDHARRRGLVPLCTPFDVPSLQRLDDWGVEAFKIASADLTNHELITAAAATGKPLIVSTGMSTEAEIVETVRLLRSLGAAFVLMHCNSTYPTPPKDINLAYMPRLGEIGGCIFGYSGHERGFETPIAAVALGAKVIEKHFTLDRSMEGADHRVSLLPDEFRAMAQAIRNVETALGSASEARRLSQGEMLNREVLAKSIVAAGPIRRGEVISRGMLAVQSPGQGLQPNRMDELVGRTAQRDYLPGEVFFPSDLNGARRSARRYVFDRPWGVPVRYHDLAALTARAPVDFVEFHLSYRDLDIAPQSVLGAPFGCGLVVHSPELFSGDHLMDLASDDQAYRARSVAELQRVVDRARELKAWFPRTQRPLVIINAGGFSQDGFLPRTERARLYDRVAEALAGIDDEGVEIIPQTMPPYPWHFGGQSHHNLFLDPHEIRAFCEAHGRRVCLDVAHTHLACNHLGLPLGRFVQAIGPMIAHLHLVDAAGLDDEGLQIGEGEVDFVGLAAELRRFAPQAGFIPEIWQGHKDGGEGFWQALDRLEAMFAASYESAA
jgi:N-acetylneuraminate synthase